MAQMLVTKAAGLVGNLQAVLLDGSGVGGQPHCVGNPLEMQNIGHVRLVLPEKESLGHWAVNVEMARKPAAQACSALRRVQNPHTLSPDFDSGQLVHVLR